MGYSKRSKVHHLVLPGGGKQCLDSRKKPGEAAVPESFEVRDEGPDSENKVAESEARDLLAREVKRFPPSQKTALILCSLRKNVEGFEHV